MGKKKDNKVGTGKKEGLDGAREQNMIDSALEEVIRTGLATAYDALEDHPVTMWELVKIGAKGVEFDKTKFDEKKLKEMEACVGLLGYLNMLEQLYIDKIIELKKKAEERLAAVPHSRNQKDNWQSLHEWVENERKIWVRELAHSGDINHYFDFMDGDPEHVYKPGMMKKLKHGVRSKAKKGLSTATLGIVGGGKE